MTRNGKGYYVAMTENHNKYVNIGNHSEFQEWLQHIYHNTIL